MPESSATTFHQQGYGSKIASEKGMYHIKHGIAQTFSNTFTALAAIYYSI